MLQAMFNFKVIAFVKSELNGKDRINYFILNPREDLFAFIERIVEVLPSKPGHSITVDNYRWTAFHKKVKGCTDFTMESNPEYLQSHSMRMGFFYKASKRTQTV